MVLLIIIIHFFNNWVPNKKCVKCNYNRELKKELDFTFAYNVQLLTI